jgi:TrkA domain protein
MKERRIDMDRSVRIDELPAIGRRFRIECDDGGALTVVIHHSGRRDVYVSARREGPPAMVSLGDSKAKMAGAALRGDLFTPSAVGGEEEVIEDLIIDWVALTPGSPGTGRTIEALGITDATGMHMISLIRGRSTTDNPAGQEVLQAGDRLVVAGRRGNLPALRRQVSGE